MFTVISKHRAIVIALGIVVPLVVVSWLAWELKFIHERRAYLDRSLDQGCQVVMGVDAERRYKLPNPTIPFWRQLLGDEAVLLPGMPLQDMKAPEWNPDRPEYDSELASRLNAEIARLFPEAAENRVREY